MRPWPTPRPAAATSSACRRCWTERLPEKPAACNPWALPRTMTPIECTAAELLAAQEQGATAEAITVAFLQAIRWRDGQVRAFLHVDEARALDQARAVDAK